MAFLYLSKVDSIRDINQGLQNVYSNLFHLGFGMPPGKSSVSYINKHRNWQVFMDYFFELLDILEPSLQMWRKYGLQLMRKIYPLDSTQVCLCPSLFDWAK